MLRRFALAAISLGSLVLLFSGGEDVGFSVDAGGGIDHVSAGTNIRALAAALVIIMVYIVAIDPEPSEQRGAVASTSRRAAAWFMDFFFSLGALSALLALLPLAKEALATGHFQWQFERDNTTGTDWVLALVSIAIMFTGMAFYWAIPVLRRGQTIGQALLALKVVSRTEAPPRLGPCLLRGLMQPLAPLLWFTRFLSDRRSYAHDDLAGVEVVTTRAGQRAAPQTPDSGGSVSALR